STRHAYKSWDGFHHISIQFSYGEVKQFLQPAHNFRLYYYSLHSIAHSIITPIMPNQNKRTRHSKKISAKRWKKDEPVGVPVDLEASSSSLREEEASDAESDQNEKTPIDVVWTESEIEEEASDAEPDQNEETLIDAGWTESESEEEEE